jgi:hypothetical protein
VTTANTAIETSDVRELSVAEMDNVGGGSSPAGFLSKVVRTLLLVPGEDYELEGCSKDFSVCQWRSK